MPAPYICGSPDYARIEKFKGKPEWEEVTWGTYRLQVEGGWLYRHGDDRSMAFVPGGTTGEQG